jgi:hypothetical protein
MTMRPPKNYVGILDGGDDVWGVRIPSISAISKKEEPATSEIATLIPVLLDAASTF